jgi:hypothetical protein
LNLKCDILFFTSAFKFNSHHYDMVLIHHATEDYYRITVKTMEMMVVAAASADVGGYTHLVGGGLFAHDVPGTVLRSLRFLILLYSC